MVDVLVDGKALGQVLPQGERQEAPRLGGLRRRGPGNQQACHHPGKR